MQMLETLTPHEFALPEGTALECRIESGGRFVVWKDGRAGAEEVGQGWIEERDHKLVGRERLPTSETITPPIVGAIEWHLARCPGCWVAPRFPRGLAEPATRFQIGAGSGEGAKVFTPERGGR